MVEILRTCVKAHKKKLINLKVTEKEHEAIKKLARDYAMGNLSEWMRYASLMFRPKRTDMVDFHETIYNPHWAELAVDKINGTDTYYKDDVDEGAPTP